jgi:hypothetical protein
MAHFRSFCSNCSVCFALHHKNIQTTSTTTKITILLHSNINIIYVDIYDDNNICVDGNGTISLIDYHILFGFGFSNI